jgi:hypothetical protein
LEVFIVFLQDKTWGWADATSRRRNVKAPRWRWRFVPQFKRLGATVAKLKGGEPLPEKAADPLALHPAPTTSDNICHMKSLGVVADWDNSHS